MTAGSIFGHGWGNTKGRITADHWREVGIDR